MYALDLESPGQATVVLSYLLGELIIEIFLSNRRKHVLEGTSSIEKKKVLHENMSFSIRKRPWVDNGFILVQK